MNINEEWFDSTSREEEGQILNKYIRQIYDERTQANFEIIDISSNKIRTNVLDSSSNNTNYIIVDTEAIITNLTVTNNFAVNNIDISNIDIEENLKVRNNLEVIGDISANDASFNNVDIKENLKVKNNLEVIGVISANDASFNNIDIEENLKVKNILEVIGDISANDASFNNIDMRDICGNDASFNNVDMRDICGNDASFNKINVKDLVVDGSLNVNNYIYNNIEVQNKTIFSTSIDISNAGTGPALKVRQAGTGESDSVALFNAGSEGDSMEIDYKGDIIMYKNLNISGDINANDASFNNIDIDENLKVINNLEVIGDISANDASFNTVEIKTDLNDNDPLIKYVSGNSYIWSDNNVEEVARNDASFNVVVLRRVSQGGYDNYLVNNEFQLFIGGQNILPSGYEVYNGGNFNNRETAHYMWDTKTVDRRDIEPLSYETTLFNETFSYWGHSGSSNLDNSLIIFLKSSYNIRDIQSIVVYGQLNSDGSVTTYSKRSKGTILELYNDTNDVNLINPLLSTHKIDTEELYHAYRWDFPAIINYNNFSSSPSTTQIYNGNVFKFTTNYIDSNLFFEVPNNTSIDNVHILPNPNESDVSLNKYNLIAPVPTQTFNVVVWRRVISPHHIVSSEIQLFIGNVNILPSDYVLYNSGNFNGRATSGYKWNSKELFRPAADHVRETKLFDSNFNGFGHTDGLITDNSIIIFLKSSHNIRDIQSIVVYGQLSNGAPINAPYINGTILELYNDTNDVNLNNPLLSTNMKNDDTHLYHAYRWDFPEIINYNNFSTVLPSNTQIYNGNVYKFTTNYSNYLFDIKYLYSPITPTYINNIQSIITDNNLVIYSDDTSFDYYSNKEGIKRFDFANIGSYTKDFSNNDLTNYIPNIETTIAESPKAGTGPALKVTQYGTGNGDSVALFNAGTEGDSMEIDYKGDINMYKDVDITGTLDVSGVTNAFVPRGIIVMWSGSNDNIPSGWVLCNGINGTPDLMNRFIIGSGSTYTTTDTGGDSSVTLTTSNLPAHSHSGSTSNNGSHSHSGTTANNGSHSHGIVIRKSGAGGASDAYRNPIWASQDLASSDAYTKTGGSHSHTFNTTNGGSHTHTFNTNNTGSGTAFNILPPYYALAYIMKT